MTGNESQESGATSVSDVGWEYYFPVQGTTGPGDRTHCQPGQ